MLRKERRIDGLRPTGLLTMAIGYVVDVIVSEEMRDYSRALQ